VVRGIEFELVDSNQTSVIPLFGFLAPQSFRITMPEPVTYACLTYFALSRVSASALDEAGNVVVSSTLSEGLETVDFTTEDEFLVIQFEFDQVSDSFPTMSVLSFCAGEPCRYYQGGIIGTELDAGGLEAAVTVRDNDVSSPAGQALILVGVGKMLAADNRLVTGGNTLQPCASGIFGGACLRPYCPRRCSFTTPVSRSCSATRICSPAVGGSPRRRRAQTRRWEALVGRSCMSVFRRRRSASTHWPCGRENPNPTGGSFFTATTWRTAPPRTEACFGRSASPRSMTSAFSIIKFAAEAPGGLILTDVLAFGALLRVADNSLLEPLLNAAYSGILFGFLTHATGNQASHCLAVLGLLGQVEDNQVVIDIFLQDHCGQLQGVLGVGLSAFAVTLGGQ